MKKILTALALITVTATSGCVDSSEAQGWDYETQAADYTCITHYTCFAISAIAAVPRVLPTEEILAIWTAENNAHARKVDKCIEEFGDSCNFAKVRVGPQGLSGQIVNYGYGKEKFVGHTIIHGVSIYDQGPMHISPYSHYVRAGRIMH